MISLLRTLIQKTPKKKPAKYEIFFYYSYFNYSSKLKEDAVVAVDCTCA